MRQYSDMLELRSSLVGTMACDSTAVGATVDTLGFADVLAVLIAGAVSGTDTNYAGLDVKIQESATPTGTGANWTDISDGDVNGSFDFDTMGFYAGTNGGIQQQKVYERLTGSVRKRYIRAHATIAGTDGAHVKLACHFLLGRPVDTLYINGGTTQATGNVEYSQLL